MTNIVERLREMNAAARYLIAGEAADEIERLRDTNKRLNRRCQIAEAGVAEKAKRGPGPLGRMLANAEATRLRSAVDEKDKEIERLQQGQLHLMDEYDRVNERQAKEIERLRGALADAKTLACTNWPNCPVQAERKRIGDAKAEEREACAKVAEGYSPSCAGDDLGQMFPDVIAEAIRNRNTGE